MPDNTEQYEEGSQNFSDEMIRRFLFGRLNATERITFEEGLFADQRLETRVRLAECELADEFAFERLGIAERKLFEQTFLVSAARQQKVRVSRALRDRFASTSEVPAVAPLMETTIRERLQRMLGLNQPSWRLALGVVLILLVGTIWSVVGPRIKKRSIAKNSPAPAATPGTNQQYSHHSNASPTPFQQITPGPRDQQGSGSAAVTVMLIPQHGYDPTHIAQVSFSETGRDAFHVQLMYKGNQESYRAELVTIAGQFIYSAGPLKPAAGSAAVDFDVPVQSLKPGDYQVKLIRIADGIEAGVATYYFRVE
jgi:hypothetical protein